ncbi:MAG: nucleotidyltransferase family protein [Lachnospirales bacterium]
MRVLGIVCEYNPFHNGHAYQIRKAREESGADALVCVMSGHYTQRGEPAIVDKWTRARMAILNGADLVMEMPSLYAMSGAESFAAAGIKLLLAAGMDVLSFGCETEKTNVLYDLAALFDQEPAVFRQELQQFLRVGESYSVSRMKAAGRYIAQAEEILKQPGSILGIEYLKALRREGRKDFPVVMVRRLGAAHKDEWSDGAGASASGIRGALRQGRILREAMPLQIAEIWEKIYESGAYCMGDTLLKEILYWRLTEWTPDQIRQAPEIGEGLEYRILKMTEGDRSWESLIESLVCKRYPASRIRRGLMNLCLGISQENRERARWEEGPGYLRILGIGPRGTELLRRIRRESSLPLVTQLHRQIKDLSESAAYTLEEEVRLTDIYTRFLVNPNFRERGWEYRKEIVKN